jgi:two-component system, OmpR family, sensor histidine kinase KdpD
VKIGIEAPKMSDHFLMNRRGRQSTVTALAVAVASVAAITAANYGLRELAPPVSTGVVYLLAVLLVSSQWGLWAGLFTSFLSAGAFNFFHIQPTGAFHVADGGNWVALAVFLIAAGVTSTLAHAARERAEEAERRRLEADLTTEMARLLLGGSSIEASLGAVGRGIAAAFGVETVTVELSWIDSGPRAKALPLVVDGDRIGTVLVPQEAERASLEAIRDRVVPALETLVAAAKRRAELESQLIETKALRRSDAVQKALLRAVSHDLRSPLTAITAAVRGLGSDTLSEAARDELAAVAAGETERLSRLVDNLLDLSRLQAGRAEPRASWCSLEEIVRAASDAAGAPAAGFDIVLDDELPALNCDAAQLERALANVLENSARFAGDLPVTVRARAAGSWVTLRVSDSGPGIPREELERIFEPFHRAVDRPGGGSGLGLAIARGFVEANGGRLRAESVPGHGSTFVFQLPTPSEAPDRTRLRDPATT